MFAKDSEWTESTSHVFVASGGFVSCSNWKMEEYIILVAYTRKIKWGHNYFV